MSLFTVLAGLFGCNKAPGSARHTVSDICEVSVSCGHMNRCYGYCFRIRRENGVWLFDAECFTHDREAETVFEDRAVNGGDIEELLGILERNDSIAYAENYKKPIKLPFQVLDDTSYNFSLVFSDGSRYTAGTVQKETEEFFYRLAEKYGDTDEVSRD